MSISEHAETRREPAQAKQIPIHIGFFEHDTGSRADNSVVFSKLELAATEVMRNNNGTVALLLESPEFTEELAHSLHNIHSAGFSYKESFILQSYSHSLLREHAYKPNTTDRIRWTYINPQKNPIKKLILQYYLPTAAEHFIRISDHLTTDWNQLLIFLDKLESKFGSRFTVIFESYSESKLSNLKRYMSEMDTCMSSGDIKGAADALFNQMWSIHQETVTRDPKAESQIEELAHKTDVAIVLSLFGAIHQMIAESLFSKGFAVFPHVVEDGEQYANLLFGIVRQIRRGENPSYFLLKRAAILSWYYRHVFASWSLLPIDISDSISQKHAIERTQILSSILSSREDLEEVEKQLKTDPEHNTFSFLNKLTRREVVLFAEK